MKGVTLPGLTVTPMEPDELLRRIFDAIRMEQRLPWLRAMVPRRFIYACPPSVN